jgi:hypothetical protein
VLPLIHSEFYKQAYNIKPSTGTLVTLWDNQCKLNEWEEYDSHESRLTSDVRAELAAGKQVSLQPYHALHLPFNLKELYDISSSHSKQIKKNALVRFRGYFQD